MMKTYIISMCRVRESGKESKRRERGQQNTQDRCNTLSIPKSIEPPVTTSGEGVSMIEKEAS